MKSLKILSLVLLLLALSLALFVWRFSWSYSAVKSFCGTLRPGVAVAEVLGRARDRGLVALRANDALIVTSSGDFGRGVCYVTTSRGMVRDASVRFND